MKIDDKIRDEKSIMILTDAYIYVYVAYIYIHRHDTCFVLPRTH